MECDVFAPCAKGGIINEQTVEKLRCRIIAGAANNQLADLFWGSPDGEGILYVPDYVINAGGVINVYEEIHGYDRDRALKKASAIYDNVQRVIELAKRDSISTAKAADRMAEERFKRG